MNKILLFLLLCLCLSAINLLTDVFIFSDDIFFKSFEDQLSANRITELISLHNEWSWLGYAFIPLIYLIKLTVVSICLFIGAFLFKITVTLKSLIKITLFAEFIFIFPPIIKLYWFSFVNVNYTLNDFQFFSPLSIVNIFDREDVDSWLVYPLSLLNLFEAGYIIALAYLMRKVIESDFAQSLRLVLLSYGTGLLIWIVFITFLNVSLT